jgi:hypothetical protein
MIKCASHVDLLQTTVGPMIGTSNLHSSFIETFHFACVMLPDQNSRASSDGTVRPRGQGRIGDVGGKQSDSLATRVRKFVVTQNRIVLIEEGPLIERLVSLLESSGGEASVVQSSGDRVCEAHILAPNLILLDLTQARGNHAAPHTNGAPTHRNGKSLADSPLFRLAVKKEEPAPRLVVKAEESPPRLAVKKEEPPRLADLPLPDPEPDHADTAWPTTSDDELVPTDAAVDSSALRLDPILQLGPVRIDRHGHWAYLRDKKLHLTPTEFRLLECFLREPGRAFTRSQLLDVSIGHSSYVLERTIDVHIRSLRAKLGPARDFVETVRGVGYRFRDTADVET